MARALPIKICVLVILVGAGSIALLLHLWGAAADPHGGPDVQNTLTREELVIQYAGTDTFAEMSLKDGADVEIVRIPTPCFRHTAIYRVLAYPCLYMSPPWTVFLVVKTSDGQVADYRPDIPGQWRKILRRERISVKGPSHAAELFRAYSIPLSSGLSYRVERFEDIPGMDAGRSTKWHADLRTKLAGVIRPLAFQSRGSGFESEFYALRMGNNANATDLVKGLCRVDRNGNIQVDWKGVVAKGAIDRDLSLLHFNKLMRDKTSGPSATGPDEDIGVGNG